MTMPPILGMLLLVTIMTFRYCEAQGLGQQCEYTGYTNGMYNYQCTDTGTYCRDGTCTACPAGRHGTATSTARSTGYFNSWEHAGDAGMTDDCTLCGTGTYSTSGQVTACSTAQQGYFASDSASDGDGSGVTSGATAQSPCPAGMYQGNTGQTSCTNTDNGFYASHSNTDTDGTGDASA